MPRTSSASTDVLYIRPTGQYWFPVLYDAPPVLDEEGGVLEARDSRVRTVHLAPSESKALAAAVLAGKIAYAWWSAVGDDFDFSVSETTVPRRLTRAVAPTDELEQLARDVIEAGRTTAFVSKNKAGYINVRWNAVRDVTDRFDRALLEAAGLLEHWRALNIWYRQCMKATRTNNNSRPLTQEEIDEYFDW
jgi:hypothetical protein